MLTETQLENQQKFRADYRGHETADAFNGLHLTAQLARIREDLSGYQVALDAAELVKLAKAIAALALHDCNVGLSEQQEKRRYKLHVKAQKIASFYGLNTTCNGDPRGYVVAIAGPGIKDNGWGDGFGIA